MIPNQHDDGDYGACFIKMWIRRIARLASERRIGRMMGKNHTNLFLV
jgi:hypothetical protein